MGAYKQGALYAEGVQAVQQVMVRMFAWVLNERGADTVRKLSLKAVIPAPNLVELYRAGAAF